MSWDGMYHQHNCKQCGKPLNADGGHPAELYAGTYTGLCYHCQNEGPYVVKAYCDGAQRISCPPHCPSWRRDREEYTAYPDCPDCHGTGRHYVSRADGKGGSYYRHCECCFERFYAHPGRKWTSERSRAIYNAALTVWGGMLKEAGLLNVKRNQEVDLSDAYKARLQAMRQEIQGRMNALQQRLDAATERRGY